MSTTNDAVTRGTTAAPTIADGLRQVADWLDEHPEITPAHAFIRVEASERADLETLAAALGDRASERLRITGDSVEIEGRWEGPSEYRDTRVYATVALKKLTDEPVRPTYRPIISPKTEAPDELDVATGEGRR